jgi:hypothetical protein
VLAGERSRTVTAAWLLVIMRLIVTVADEVGCRHRRMRRARRIAVILTTSRAAGIRRRAVLVRIGSCCAQNQTAERGIACQAFKLGNCFR